MGRITLRYQIIVPDQISYRVHDSVNMKLASYRNYN